jgi:CDP-glucose 4,6-dehydratase
VTGHTGFKGSWLALWLAQLGAKVTGYALAPPTEPSNFEISDVQGVLTRHHQADVRDRAALRAALEEAAPDVVLHLAAQALVRRSYRDPLETFEVNFMGTANLLEAIRELQIPCAVVVVTSDKCYENREWSWGYRESDPMGGHDPYSASKGAAELLVSSYRRSFFDPTRRADHGVRLASARAGNVIGGGDWSPDHVVVDVVNSLRDQKPVPVRNPVAVRPWQHVLESLSGYLTLAGALVEDGRPALCDAWNFGPGIDDAVPVRELVELFVDAWGEGSWVDASDPSQPHEAGLLRLSVEKARFELGWRPRWSVEEAVAQTVAWYRRYFDEPTRLQEVCLRQIEAYQATPGDPSNG